MTVSSLTRKAAFLATTLLSTLAAASAGAAVASGKNDEVKFDLIPNAAFVDCLRADYAHQPKAHVTVTRGKLNDTLTLDLEWFKPGLQFDLFTIEHSPFFEDGTKDGSFKAGKFGMAWYQSDVEVSKGRGGRTQIKTILLDQIFGFDSDVGLNPVNTFHVGFWFNNPADAQPCQKDPIKPTPFNGEHKAGPLAMISGTDVATNLGPLCTDPTFNKKGLKCNP
jgi:hypothetical protein